MGEGQSICHIKMRVKISSNIFYLDAISWVLCMRLQQKY